MQVDANPAPTNPSPAGDASPVKQESFIGPDSVELGMVIAGVIANAVLLALVYHIPGYDPLLSVVVLCAGGIAIAALPLAGLHWSRGRWFPADSCQALWLVAAFGYLTSVLFHFVEMNLVFRFDGMFIQFGVAVTGLGGAAWGALFLLAILLSWGTSWRRLTFTLFILAGVSVLAGVFLGEVPAGTEDRAVISTLAVCKLTATFTMLLVIFLRLAAGFRKWTDPIGPMIFFTIHALTTADIVAFVPRYWL